MIQNDSEINKKISSLPEDQKKAIEWLIQHLEIIDAYKAEVKVSESEAKKVKEYALKNKDYKLLALITYLYPPKD